MHLWRLSGRRMRIGALAGAAAAAGLFTFWRSTAPPPPAPEHPLRIGFESNPPVQIRTGSGYSGLGVEAVNEAARRAGVQLHWVETGTSSDEAFREGLVDLWPLMVHLPERKSHVHFARPWMHSSNVLLMTKDAPNPDRNFRGRIAVFTMPLHVKLLRESFPEAQVLEVPELRDLVKQVCLGTADAAFFEARVAQTELREKPAECSSSVLRAQPITGMRFDAGLASTFEYAGVADRIQKELDNMFRDGTLAVLIAKYSYFGLDDTWASYERLEAQAKWRWLSWVGFGLALVGAVTLWLAGSLRQRKRTEAMLRESEARFRSLANTAPVMIVASGPDGGASFFNKVWLDFTGRTAEQELGYGWLESVHPEDREPARAEIARSFAARSTCKAEYRLRRADGQYRHMMCTGVPNFGPDGVIGGYIATCLDLTDIKSAQEEARERQNLESLGVLAGGIAHDFNNLLGGTLAYAELAQIKLAEGGAPDDELRQIRAVAVRGSEIVRQLMIFAGKDRGILESVDLSTLVGEMLELLKISISKHAVLETDLQQGLPAVRANSAQLRQVVMNLVTNASEALGDREGVIRVVSQRLRVGSGPNAPEIRNLPDGEYVALEVSDTGCGMTPDTQRRIFDPFFTTKFAGRGMGLAVVQRIVQRLGGAIQLESALDQGASMRIVLPCASEMAPVQETNGAARTRPRESQQDKGRTILVVEDELDLLAAVSKMLQRRGYRVIQAADGTSALERIRSLKDPIDAMLLDITLPGVSSREVFEEAERLRPGLVVILTSAYSQESVAASLAGLTVEHFIRKPFPISTLVSLLEETLTARAAFAHSASPDSTA